MTTDNFDLDAGGVKFDAGKIRMDLVPMDAVMAEAAVYTYGAIKYDDWNWAKGLRKGRIMAALLRHAAAYLMGEERDAESGLPHTWHMRCCTGMLVAGELRGVAIEDREEAVASLHEVQRIFTEDMKDPKGTVKNGGGSIVEPRRMPASEWKKLDHDLPLRLRLVSNPADAHDPRLGLMYPTKQVLNGSWSIGIFEEVV